MRYDEITTRRPLRAGPAIEKAQPIFEMVNENRQTLVKGISLPGVRPGHSGARPPAPPQPALVLRDELAKSADPNSLAIKNTQRLHKEYSVKPHEPAIDSGNTDDFSLEHHGNAAVYHQNMAAGHQIGSPEHKRHSVLYRFHSGIEHPRGLKDPNNQPELTGDRRTSGAKHTLMTAKDEMRLLHKNEASRSKRVAKGDLQKDYGYGGKKEIEGLLAKKPGLPQLGVDKPEEKAEKRRGIPPVNKSEDEAKGYALGEGPKKTRGGGELWVQHPPAPKKPAEKKKIDLGTAPVSKAFDDLMRTARG